MRYLLTLLFCLFCTQAQPSEILSGRNYNQKVFEDNGVRKYKIHVRQIHYKDSHGSFADIDPRLNWDGLSKKWKHSKASYIPAIPEYADGVFEFRNLYEGADFTIQFKPVASHVQGTYHEDGDGSYVLYPNAFGQGIDLKAYSYWSGVKKVICVNSAPSDLNQDLVFDFELVISSLAGLEITRQDLAKFDFTKQGEFYFSDAVVKIGIGDKFTFFRNALMWDSGKLSEAVNIKIIRSGPKVYIRKIIPASFLQKAVFPIYTDHPTSYYSGAGDGHVSTSHLNAGWTAVHDNTGSYANASYTGTEFWVQAARESSTRYTIKRVFFPVDTSGIADDATISSASIYFYINEVYNDDNDGDDWVNIIGETAQASTSSLTANDIDNCGAIDNPTEGATRVDIGSVSATAYNQWTLNSTGIGWINKTGYSKFGAREGHDCIDSPISTSGQYNEIYIASSEDTSGTKDPYLEVTTGSTSAEGSVFYDSYFEDLTML